jgi:hypothetical protein
VKFRERIAPPRVNQNMKLAAPLLMIWLGTFAGAGVAATTPEPTLPDPAYCSRRDADPEKCVIQDGPPQKHIVRKKPAAPPKSVSPSPEPTTGSAPRQPEPAPIRRQ